MKEKKPPIGLRDECIIKEERIREIFDAVGRYLEAGKYIPERWRLELMELMIYFSYKETTNDNN